MTDTIVSRAIDGPVVAGAGSQKVSLLKAALEKGASPLAGEVASPEDKTLRGRLQVGDQQYSDGVGSVARSLILEEDEAGGGGGEPDAPGSMDDELHALARMQAKRKPFKEQSKKAKKQKP